MNKQIFWYKYSVNWKNLMNSNNFKLFIKIFLIFFFGVCLLFLALYQKSRSAENGDFLTDIKNFFNVVELKTFDARQKIIANGKQTSKDIIVVEIDENTYSAFTSKMGEWPVSRSVYADVIEYIEKQSPKAIGLDLMFINSDKYDRKNDERLAETISKYDNVFTSINFDYVSPENREPVKLPDYYEIGIENFSKINFMHSNKIIYKNCRALIPEIMNIKANVGNINSFNDMDGVLRRLYPFVIYDNKYYPHLSLAVALYMYENQIFKNGLNVKVDENSNILIADKKIPIGEDSAIILNWYKKNSFERVSFLDVYKASKIMKSEISMELFKD